MPRLIPFLTVFGLLPLSMAQEGRTTSLEEFIEQRCSKCHGTEDPKGNLNLVALESEGLSENRDEWLLVAEELSLQVMPPHPEPKPARSEYLAMLSILRDSLGDEVPELSTPVTRAPFSALRRRTGREIAGAILALTDIETPADALPMEAGLHVYDVVGAGVTLDAAWLDRWLSLADSVSREAIRLPEPDRIPHVQASGRKLSSPRQSGGRLSTQGIAHLTHEFPRDGDYTLRGKAWAQQAGTRHAWVALTLDGKRIEELQVTGEGPDSAITMTVHMRVTKGPHQVGVAFLNDYFQPKEKDPRERDRNVIVEQVSIEGPLDPQPPTSFQTELLLQAGKGNGTQAQLGTAMTLLANRAWQEAPIAADIQRLLELVQEEPSPQARLRLGLAAVLASPRFLLVGEVGEPGTPLSGPALATRLALFLWGSLPDEQLLQFARNNTLQETGVLEREVERMLQDPRARGLAAGFVPQWLQIVRLKSHAPSKELFPEYGAQLREAMLAEPVELFHSILQDGLPARDLVRADWTMINQQLADHYGLPATGHSMETERYSLTETVRRGILGHGAILTASSDPGRTSPVLRGKWVLEALLGDAPPPPAPDTSVLDVSAPAELGLSMRERLKLHRTEPGCASCHVAMDPLGFALERFDAVGRTRVGKVDEQGTLPDGTQLDGPLGLSQMLTSDARFLPHLTRSLATYAVGRPLSADDLDTLERAIGEVHEPDPPLGTLVRTIVLSDLFRRQPRDTQDL